MAVLSKPESQDVVPQGWEEPVVAPYLPKAGSPVPSRSVALIGTYADGLNIPGKVTAGLFFPIFDYVLRQFDARVACYENADDFVQADTTDFAGIAILVYREALDDLDAVQEAERRILAKHPDALVVHPAELGRTLGNKILTNKFLAGAGVPVTRLVEEPICNETVLSNHLHSTQQPVCLVNPGELLDRGRYNTVFVDTRHRLNGVDYFCFLRVYGVGDLWVATYPGFKPVSDDDPAVHFQEPPDPALINYFSYFATIRYQAEVVDLCRRIGTVLGLGFYTMTSCRAASRASTSSPRSALS